MPTINIISEKRFPELIEFKFRFDGKEYKVTPKTGGEDIIEAFYKFLKTPFGRSHPFSYEVDRKNLLNIDNTNPLVKSTTPAPIAPQKPEFKPDSEQMSLFASKIDNISNLLENKGFIKEAYKLDIISNTLESCWDCNHVNLFKDELENNNIDVMKAKKVLDLADKYNLLI